MRLSVPRLPCLVVLLAATACAGSPAPRPAPAPRPRLAVPITDVVRRMIAGEREPHLSEDAMRQFLKRGQPRPVLIVKLCLDAEGSPSEINLVKGSGVAAADASVLAAVGGWRFEPYVKDGEAVGLCTAIMFRYNISGPPPPRG